MSFAHTMDLALLPPAQAAAGVALAQRGLLKCCCLRSSGDLKRNLDLCFVMNDLVPQL